MKNFKLIGFVIVVMLVAMITSCKSDEERMYESKKWLYEQKMLELEYQKECLDLKTDAEIKDLIRWTDSLSREGL